jgi:hypothetical protein
MQIASEWCRNAGVQSVTWQRCVIIEFCGTMFESEGRKGLNCCRENGTIKKYLVHVCNFTSQTLDLLDVMPD